jgi:hypothetical protein
VVPRETPNPPTSREASAAPPTPGPEGSVGPTFRSGGPQAPPQSRPRETPDLKVGPTGPPDLKVGTGAVAPAELKEAFLGEIRKAKKFVYGTVVAQAQRIDVEGDKVVFVFGPQHRALRVQLEQHRSWLEAAASQLAGRRMTVAVAEGTAVAPDQRASGQATSSADGPSASEAAPGPDRQQALKERALSDTGVQTMLDVFAAEIKDVEEM